MSDCYEFLSDAFSAPDFLRLLKCEGPFKDSVCCIRDNEITKAEAFCKDAHPKNLTAEFARLGLNLLRNNHLDNIKIITSDTELAEMHKENPIVVTNLDGHATLLEKRHGRKTIRFKNTLKPYTGFTELNLNEFESAKWRSDGYIAPPRTSNSILTNLSP